MGKTVSHNRIYRAVVDSLERSPLVREELIKSCALSLGLDREKILDRTAGGEYSNLRSRIGALINEMHSRELIGIDKQGRYYLVSARPVVIRIERCESEIIKALSEKPMTKTELRDRLKNVFGTSKTATTRDDDTLSSIMGQLLKRMQNDGVITIVGGEYRLSSRLLAHKDDVNSMMALKSDFLSRLHAKGGEFFENYFMLLLKKYLERHGKKILSCSVTAGSADGGIDGIVKVRDSFGFVETVMVQTKNRFELSTETDVRGFYGAVCAKRGSRGIFVTTSDFHENANIFMNELDDLVGINGSKLFRMAIECSYGIRCKGDVYEIDKRVI